MNKQKIGDTVWIVNELSMAKLITVADDAIAHAFRGLIVEFDTGNVMYIGGINYDTIKSFTPNGTLAEIVEWTRLYQPKPVFGTVSPVGGSGPDATLSSTWVDSYMPPGSKGHTLTSFQQALAKNVVAIYAFPCNIYGVLGWTGGLLDNWASASSAYNGHTDGIWFNVLMPWQLSREEFIKQTQGPPKNSKHAARQASAYTAIAGLLGDMTKPVVIPTTFFYSNILKKMYVQRPECAGTWGSYGTVFMGKPSPVCVMGQSVGKIMTAHGSAIRFGQSYNYTKDWISRTRAKPTGFSAPHLYSTGVQVDNQSGSTWHAPGQYAEAPSTWFGVPMQNILGPVCNALFTSHTVGNQFESSPQLLGGYSSVDYLAEVGDVMTWGNDRSIGVDSEVAIASPAFLGTYQSVADMAASNLDYPDSVTSLKKLVDLANAEDLDSKGLSLAVPATGIILAMGASVSHTIDTYEVTPYMS